MPTGQVLRWQTRIITQPETTSGAVAKPNSSAPSSAAMTTSRPVFIWPSTWTTMRSRRPFSSSTCCVSARPSSHGTPPCLMLVSGEAPVPPSWPEISTTSACALRHAGGDRADAGFGDQLHVDARLGVGVLQVVNQLRDVLDRVDVVVRRRRDQRHAGRRVAHLGDPRIDLVAGQLAALAGLGALRHLDLQIGGVDQVLAGHAEAARGHLLDRAAPPVAVRVAAVARGSSPPSPLFERPPMRFIAMASVSCASELIEPYDIAPVEKRLTIASTDSTSSIGTGVAPPA